MAILEIIFTVVCLVAVIAIMILWMHAESAWMRPDNDPPPNLD